MSFDFFDHTGDVGIRVTAPTAEALFAEAARAFTAVLTDPERVRPAEQHGLSLEAPALDLLLADWLGELLHLFETRAFLVHRATATVVRGPDRCRLTALVAGEPFDPARHAVNVLVKGVTYHQLSVEEVGAEWRARVILDI